MRGESISSVEDGRAEDGKSLKAIKSKETTYSNNTSNLSHKHQIGFSPWNMPQRIWTQRFKQKLNSQIMRLLSGKTLLIYCYFGMWGWMKEKTCVFQTHNINSSIRQNWKIGRKELRRVAILPMVPQPLFPKLPNKKIGIQVWKKRWTHYSLLTNWNLISPYFPFVPKLDFHDRKHWEWGVYKKRLFTWN